MALTKSAAAITDWTAVAQGAVGESAEIDISGAYEARLHIQAFLDTETAHTGTEFIVQVSSAASGNEDWQEIGRFVDLVGTANKEDITNNPAAAGTTVFTVASTTGYTVADVPAPWRAIKDATLVNSELLLQTAVSANTSVTFLEGSTNEHANTADLYSIAISRTIALPFEASRARLIVNNNYDSNGSTCVYKCSLTKVTAL